MLEYKNPDLEKASPDSAYQKVKVIGIGGAGANVLDRIALEGMEDAELLSLNTDIRALNTSVANEKIQLGKNLTQGLGAGGDPELGLEAALASAAEVSASLTGRKLVFICAGLGGGTGSGATPVVARLAREQGAFVVVFVNMPFSFEGKRRQAQANAALAELQAVANALITFDNDRMGSLVLPKEGIQQAFAAADQIISQSVRAVTTLVAQPGLIRIGMDELLTALKNHNSRCLFGFGQAKGENRAIEALNRAMKSPLLDKGALLERASNLIVHVAGGDNMTLFEVELLMKELSKHVEDDAQILFGTGSDKTLGDQVAVTIISSMGGPFIPDHDGGGGGGGAPESAPDARPGTAGSTVAAAASAAGTVEAAAAAALTPAAAVAAPAPAPAPTLTPAAAPAAAAAPAFFTDTPDPEPAIAEPKPAPQPAPASEASELEPEPEPEPVVEVKPALSSEPEPPPVLDLDLQPDADSDLDLEPDSDSDLDFLVTPADEAEPVPSIMEMLSPKPKPVDEPLPEPLPEPAPAPTPTLEPEPELVPHGSKEHQQSATPALEVEPVPEPLPEPVAAKKSAAAPETTPEVPVQEELIPEKKEPRGRFDKTEPTVVDGEDLDVPSFLRKKS